MSYLIPDKTTGLLIDLARFAADLCHALGGRDVVCLPGNIQRASFMVGSDQVLLRVPLDATRVEITLDTPDVSLRARHHSLDYAAKTANVSPDGRTIERIAADVRRRVIDASAEAMAKRRELAAMHADARAIVSAAEPRLRALGFEVKVSASGLSLAASQTVPRQVQAQATETGVVITQAADLTLDQFERIVAIINEDRK